MTDQQIADAWLRYYRTGDKDAEWAVSELNEFSHQDPVRTWSIIRAINRTEIPDEEWRKFADGVLGCGPLENMITAHTDTILDAVLSEAKQNTRLRNQLSAIYESSVEPRVWTDIQAVLGLQQEDANQAMHRTK